MGRYFRKIQGEHVFLSPIDIEDLETYTRWINDPAVSENIAVSWQLFTLEKERRVLEDMAKDGYNFAIVRNEGQELIGSISLLEVSHIYGSAQCGLFIGEAENRGQGYGTEALRLLLGFAFGTLNMNNVMLKVFAFNAPARRCYEKAGFKVIGTRRRAYFARGAYHDEIYMDILAAEIDY